MLAKAVDYSSARPDPAFLAASGYTHVLRYLSHEPSKNLSPVERDRLHAAGLAIGLAWESTANRALAGYSAGWADAAEANRQADALGFPRLVIFYAVDLDATAAQIRGPITEYLRGAADSSRRPVGVYGHYGVIEGLVPGVVMCGWQCAAWSGTGTGSGGRSLDGRRLSARACLFQRAQVTLGGQADHNDVLDDPSPWAWPPAGQPDPRRLAMKAVSVPQSNAQWVLVWDGNGRPRRFGLTSTDAGDAVGQAYLDGAVALEGPAADWFWALPESNTVTADTGALQLTELVRQDIASLADALKAVTGALAGQPASADDTAVAQALAKLQDLVDRVTAAGQALAGTGGPTA